MKVHEAFPTLPKGRPDERMDENRNNTAANVPMRGATLPNDGANIMPTARGLAICAPRPAILLRAAPSRSCAGWGT